MGAAQTRRRRAAHRSGVAGGPRDGSAWLWHEHETIGGVNHPE
jgi:hypothetical protein